MAEIETAVTEGGPRAGLSLMRDYYRWMGRADLTVRAATPAHGPGFPLIVLVLHGRAVALTIHETRDLVHQIEEIAEDLPRGPDFLRLTGITDRLLAFADRVEAGEFADG